MAANHDSHYKLLFSHPELVHDLLVEFVSVVRTDTLQLDTLERVNGCYTSEAGDTRYEDMVWKVHLADQWLYMYLLLEFQSRSDDWMALRMHVYASLLLQDLQRQKKLSSDGKLPPVLPIVLYHGTKGWEAATDVADLFASTPEGLRGLQPSQRYLLIADRENPVEDLDGKINLVTALFRLESSRTIQDMKRVLLSLSERLADPIYATLRRDFSQFATWQLRRKVKDPTIPETIDLLEILSMLEERRLEWWEQWKHEGVLEGRREGRLEGLHEGRLAGQLEGERKGVLAGEARLLQRLLERRFRSLPAWVEARLAQAAEEDLVRWGERVLDPTAISLEQLLSS
jgi:predicted transposase YdaD